MIISVVYDIKILFNLLCYITLKSNQEAFGMNAEEQDLIDSVTRKALRKRKKENSNLQDEKRRFFVDAIYNTQEVARILRRTEKTVRTMCRTGQIRCRIDHGGYLITGWAIRDFAEGRCIVNE